ncbi:MAG: hypothetical protein PVF57_08985 [Pseudomonadales bacterium]|jgi:ABC-type microcin C transport system duplicated ATPase subunit YejF
MNSPAIRQRTSIALALVPKPELVVLDESSSALSVSAQVQTIDLLWEQQFHQGLAYDFVSDDLETVRALAPRILIKQLAGRKVGRGEPLSRPSAFPAERCGGIGSPQPPPEILRH